MVPSPKISSLEGTPLNCPNYALLVNTKHVATPVHCSQQENLLGWGAESAYPVLLYSVKVSWGLGVEGQTSWHWLQPPYTNPT